MKHPFYILFILISLDIDAQDCSCGSGFQDLIRAVEENYALFSFKVSEKKQNIQVYKALKQSLLAQAQDAGNKECADIYESYITYFNDRHIRVSPKLKIPSYSEDVSQNSKYERIDIDTTTIYTKWKENMPTDPLIGIWESDYYKVIILDEKNTNKNRNYAAIILDTESSAWSFGEVKFEVNNKVEDEYPVNYYMGNRSLKDASIRFINDQVIKMSGLGLWRKLMPLEEGNEIIPWEELEDDLSYQDLGDNNYYISIESFTDTEEIIQKFVSTNHDKLLEANTFIIDVRNNGGGSDYSYAPLLPYIYSGPVSKPFVGMWLSKENKKMFNEWYEDVDLTDPELTEEDIEYLNTLRTEEDIMFYNSDEMYFVDTLDTIHPGPRHVAIITNKWSASSAETFVYGAIQSDRVTTFGQSTAGVIDGFNGNDIIHECFALTYPTCVRSRNLDEHAIDPHGIEPDILLAEDKDDVISFIINYFNYLDK